MNMLVWDIETTGLPDVELAAICPDFTPPPHPGEFDPTSVAVGNLKDQTKITEKIEKAKTAHLAAITDYQHTVAEAARNHFAEFKSRAALSPLTGRVLAIGYRAIDKAQVAIDHGEQGDEGEAGLLARFWNKYDKCRKQQGGPRKMVGWNVFGFDLPFLIRRSWLHGVAVPSSVMDPNWKWFDQNVFADLMLRFAVGEWKGNVKLDVAAKFLGCGSKNGDGAMFGELWVSDRAKAIEYLTNDLNLTAGVAQRMGMA
jgi:hypothetical protein